MTTLVNSVLQRVARCLNMKHEKQNGCVMRHVMRLVGAPGEARGAHNAAWAEAKSWYDLINNEEVSVCRLRELRANVVRDALPSAAHVAVFHDVSVLDFTSHDSKHSRMAVGDGEGLGYEYHACVAWDVRQQRFLGVLHDTVISEEGPDDAGMMDYDGDPLLQNLDADDRQRLPFNHRHQLAVHIRGLAKGLPGQSLIHVGDREFDDVPAMAAAQDVGHDFIFRVLGNRRVMMDNGDTIMMEELVAGLPMKPYKTVGLDARGHVAYGETRPKRLAELSIGASRVWLYLPASRGKRRNIKLPSPMAVNLVVIRELDPLQGEKPLCWLLFTSLPIDHPEQQAWVGAVYEQRWRIEEYFKLLKSGFGIEHTHFTGAAQIAKIIIFYSLAAMAILTLKTDLGIAPIGPLNKEMYAKVRHAMAHPDAPEIEPSMQIFALILRCGGWRGRRTDPIGPTILMRGTIQLMTALSLVTQFPELIKTLAKQCAADFENAYTW